MFQHFTSECFKGVCGLVMLVLFRPFFLQLMCIVHFTAILGLSAVEFATTLLWYHIVTILLMFYFRFMHCLQGHLTPHMREDFFISLSVVLLTILSILLVFVLWPQGMDLSDSTLTSTKMAKCASAFWGRQCSEMYFLLVLLL